MEEIKIKINEINELITKIIENNFDKTIKCTNNYLQNMFFNKIFILQSFDINIGIGIDNINISGQESLIAIKILINILNTADVLIATTDNIDTIIKTLNENEKPYIIYAFPYLNILLNNNDYMLNISSSNIENKYNLVSIAYNCGNNHSINSICYDINCNDLKHTFINENKIFINNLNQLKIDLPIDEQAKLGKLCSIKTLKLENITYELNTYERKIQSEIKIFCDIHDFHLPLMYGGNNIFFNKYLKYKNKNKNI